MTADDLHWYVVYTQPRAEYGVAQALARAGYGVVYLHYRGTISHARKKIAVLKPLFPRYVIVGCGPGDEGEMVSVAKRVRGVAAILYCGDRLLEVPAAEVAGLKARGDEKGMISPPVRDDSRQDRFEAGSWVRITEGPLKSFWGTVEHDDGQSVRVFVSMFNGTVSAVMFPDNLEPIEEPPASDG